MSTIVSAQFKQDRKVGKWLYAGLFLLIATSLVYVLVANAASGNALASGRTPLGEAAITFIQNTLRVSAASPVFPPLVLAAAFLLGGLHALTPGHNKTLTGAYLVGVRAQLRHAVLIGAATAFSHTASAIVIGVLALSTTGQVASAQFLRWIGLPSGILTMVLGVWLLRRYAQAHAPHPHSHDHEHSHDHDHDHDHHGHSHEHVPPDRVTLGGLVAMGLMHGTVPTIDALAILLVALSINRVGLGIGLIVTYSLGIASVLIAIGALFIRAQGLLIGNPRFEGLSRRAPALAATVVILLGLSLIVRTLMA